MSQKVCVLRSAAEVEALAVLLKLKDLVLAHHLTEAEARAELDRHQLPDCARHRHLQKREARRLERSGGISFVPGWEEQYAAAERISRGRVFYPDRVFSGDRAIGRLEMYGIS